MPTPAGPGPLVQVQGGRQLRAALRLAGVDLADLRQVNAQAAAIAAGAASARAPRRTGRLAGSVRPGATRTQAVVRAGRASVPYAGVIHYGWASRHIKAQPFALDAAHATEPRWIQLYLNRLHDLIATIERTAHP